MSDGTSGDGVGDAANGWIECGSWDDLPLGTWLIKTNDDEENPYHVAEVSPSPDGKFIVAGNHFTFDMECIVAYTAFEPYEGMNL